jgi:hypothetical protein
MTMQIETSNRAALNRKPAMRKLFLFSHEVKRQYVLSPLSEQPNVATFDEHVMKTSAAIIKLCGGDDGSDDGSSDSDSDARKHSRKHAKSKLSIRFKTRKRLKKKARPRRRALLGSSWTPTTSSRKRLCLDRCRGYLAPNWPLTGAPWQKKNHMTDS